VDVTLPIVLASPWPNGVRLRTFERRDQKSMPPKRKKAAPKKKAAKKATKKK
jgi:hypothetical protein